MKAIGYARVSSTKQLEGDSLAQQERQIVGYAMMHGLTLDRVIVEEGVSASVPLRDRPQGAELLAGLASGDAVIAAKLDRLFRSALDTLNMVEEFRKRGIALHLLDLGGEVTGGGLSKLMLTMTAAFAEMERDRIRERVAGAKKHGREEGRYLGGRIPVGYEVSGDGFLVRQPAMDWAVPYSKALHANGKSLRDIQYELNRRGLRVSHVGVKSLLKQVEPVQRSAA